jgi:hypothetical protein
MRPFHAKLARFQLEPDGATSIWVASDKKLEAATGQYFQTFTAGETDLILPIPLYAGETAGKDARLFGAIPAAWAPGASLVLRGPLGKGFHLPQEHRRLALLSFDNRLSYLLPLIITRGDRKLDVAVFSDQPLSSLPPYIEIYPLEAAEEASTWADFLAIEASAANLPGLAQRLGFIPGMPLPCPGQVLVHTDMPCGGLAECGVCAINTRNGRVRLACEDGPVFDLTEVLV